MKNILLIGEKYSSNLGDGIICDTVEFLLKDKNFNIVTLDISGRSSFENDCNSFSLIKEYKVYFKSLIKKGLSILGYNRMGKNLLKIFSDFRKSFDDSVSEMHYDYIIFAGGQMFIDTFIHQINYVCAYGEKNNVKIIFNCCGTGKILNKKVLAEILNSKAVNYISVRDGSDLLKKYTDKDIIKCCDNAVYASYVYDSKKINSYSNGIGIMFSTLQSPLKQIRFWGKVLKKLINDNTEFVLFTNGSYKDYCFAKYLLSIFNLDTKKYLLSRPVTSEELVSQISSFDKILSMRLHSMIVAYSFDIPSIAICWDNKVKSFFSEIGLSNNCYTLDSNVNVIIKKLNKINKDTIDEKIKQNKLIEIKNNINSIKKIVGGTK